VKRGGSAVRSGVFQPDYETRGNDYEDREGDDCVERIASASEEDDQRGYAGDREQDEEGYAGFCERLAVEAKQGNDAAGENAGGGAPTSVPQQHSAAKRRRRAGGDPIWARARRLARIRYGPPLLIIGRPGRAPGRDRIERRRWLSTTGAPPQ